jgi:hypothetical protein
MKTRETTAVRTISLLFIALALAGCGGGAGSEAGPVVEQYFQAIVEGDEDRIATLACADWESSARADVAAFYGVEARLEGVACGPVETGQPAGEDSVVIECSGAIVATYDDEDSTFELAGKQFEVVQQGGEWLVCGYAE